MEKIESYRAEDGKIFESMDDCYEYEKELAIKEFFKELFNTHDIGYGSIDKETFIEEILTKRTVLKAIL